MADEKPLWMNIVELMERKAQQASTSGRDEENLRELGDALVRSQWQNSGNDRSGAIIRLNQIAGKLPHGGCHDRIAAYLREIAHTLGAEPIPGESGRCF